MKTPLTESLIVQRTKESIVDDYTKSSHLPLDSQKGMWGSEESMLNRFALGLGLIDWPDVHRWLDIGCGTGRFFQVVENSGHRFDCLAGVDITPSILDQARKRKFSSPTEFLVADLESLPEASDGFDLVTLIGVLQLCGMPLERALAASTKSLKPGGQVFLTTKHLGWKAFRKEGFQPDVSHSWFTFEDVCKAAKACGLDIVEAGGFIPAEDRVTKLNDSHTLFLHGRKRD